MKMNQRFMKHLLTAVCCLFLTGLFAQRNYWQQEAKYDMEIDFDVETNRYMGKQELKYRNNSPDDLNRVFYHLYFNAFQPGSMMDVRNQNLPDSDKRVGQRIGSLKPDEIGFIRVLSLTQDGKPVKFETVGTILEVELNKPIEAGEDAEFKMEWEAQVPVQIRRSGRDNAEGIEYSMTQWYPKMAEYDDQGWHANPYIGREFYGIWGDFEVKITIDADYVIGGTGYLQNAKEIGHGYEGKQVDHKPGSKITYHFKAPMVHDFAWAADPDFTHDVLTRDDGVDLHFFYQGGEDYADTWKQLPSIMDKAMDFIEKNYGEYPYEQYSFIQGGDGGMEYPMATLITGNRPLPSLVGVSVHELMHNWYQMLMGTNEALYAWMDEGFTSWASSETMNYLRSVEALPGTISSQPHGGSYAFYRQINEAGYEEPMTVHADHYKTNAAYGMAAYGKGAVFLEQLRGVIGEAAFRRGMLRYYNDWKFKHPKPNDFIRVMEKESGLELDWYREYMVNTIATADYAIASVEEGKGKNTTVTLQRIGDMPLPTDVLVTYKNGDTEHFNIPLVIMRGNKPDDGLADKYTVLEDWPWVNPTYSFSIPAKMKKITSIQLDPMQRAADFDRENDAWERE